VLSSIVTWPIKGSIIIIIIIITVIYRIYQYKLKSENLDWQHQIALE